MISIKKVEKTLFNNEPYVYADGIPYVYVKNSTIQQNILSNAYGTVPSTWSSANVIIKE